ncbi:MAG: hypothetical protein QOE45_2309 [Frankiaceae bacterium]|jgi:hypothetical protein|nr:hypothetical protein [Frankiaceae bacterium]
MNRRFASLFLTAAMVTGMGAVALPASAAENCRYACCSDDECLCIQVWIDGHPYGPCLLANVVHGRMTP